MKCSFHRCSSNWKTHPVFPHSAKFECIIDLHTIKICSLSNLLPFCEILRKGPGFMRIVRKRPVATCVAWTTDVLCLPLLLHSLVHSSNIAGKFWIRANWIKETNKSVADIQLFLLQFSPSFNPFGLTTKENNSLTDNKCQTVVDNSYWSSKEHWMGSVFKK